MIKLGDNFRYSIEQIMNKGSWIQWDEFLCIITDMLEEETQYELKKLRDNYSYEKQGDYKKVIASIIWLLLNDEELVGTCEKDAPKTEDELIKYLNGIEYNIPYSKVDFILNKQCSKMKAERNNKRLVEVIKGFSSDYIHFIKNKSGNTIICWEKDSDQAWFCCENTTIYQMENVLEFAFSCASDLYINIFKEDFDKFELIMNLNSWKFELVKSDEVCCTVKLDREASFNKGVSASLIWLTSKGLNTKEGRTRYFKRLLKRECNIIFKSLLIISLAPDSVNELIVNEVVKFGFDKELIDVVNGRDKTKYRFEKYDFVYVGECERAFDVMNVITTYNLNKVIANSKANGFVYMGASAGAAILSEDISYVIRDFDQLDDSKVDCGGLGIICDSLIIPHYTKKEMKEYIRYYKKNENIDLKSTIKNFINIPEGALVELIL